MRPLILILAACLAAGPAFAQDTTRRVRGAIDAVNGRTLSVTDRGGNPLTITLKPNATIVAIVPASLSDITKGSFVGSAAMPGPDGRLLAIEVHIFPESMRGTGEGHRPFDLQPESTMTARAAKATAHSAMVVRGTRSRVMQPMSFPPRIWVG